MKINLMFRDRGFDVNAPACYGRDILSADLELNRVLDVMAQGDKTILAVCGTALFNPLQNIEDIKFRQSNLEDARKNKEAVRGLFSLTSELEKLRGSAWRTFSTTSVSDTYKNALSVVDLYADALKLLRSLADKDPGFSSEGFKSLYSMLKSELNDSFFAELKERLSELRDDDELLISSSLSPALTGVNYTLRKKEKRGAWRHWRLAPSYEPSEKSDTFNLDINDIQNRRDRALNELTGAVSECAKYLEGFFTSLRCELAFYVGCLNLDDALQSAGMPVCVPDILPAGSKSRVWSGLYDVSLALTKKSKVTGNDLTAENKMLYIISGANQGGKSTFLRSIGQAQLMAQCGMFTGANSISVPIRKGLFSHFKREEDRNMRSGKLDEELQRISNAAGAMVPGSMMLLNESFASTNEREGSEICRQITQAFIESGIEVFSVSHMYTYATAFLNEQSAQFLRAQRLEGGARTFKIEPGEPLTTAFGADLYNKIFN